MEKLIEIVQQYPILYDTNHVDYSKIKLKEEVWSSIAEKLHLTTQAVKAQWKSLRHCHRDALRRRKTRSGQAAGYKKYWAYERHMEYLLPFMNSKLTSLDTTMETEMFSSNEQNNIEIQKTKGEQEDETAIEEEQSIIKEELIIQDEANERNEEIVSQTRKKRKMESNVNLTLQRSIHKEEKRYKKRDVTRQEIMEKRLKLEKEQANALYQFFISMYNSTRMLPRHLQFKIKRTLFEAVSNAEEQTFHNSCLESAFNNIPENFSSSRSSSSASELIPIADDCSPNVPQSSSFVEIPTEFVKL
ncbi:uncharacterized protein LOC143346933 [Colletes latitarsis]|uniref:uncharacterized protein LOC143346933 n=1 Tax=Colletes latitarsis TaxID=2605962 RepID=UPI004036E568